MDYSRNYVFVCKIPPKKFMSWKADELKKIEIGKSGTGTLWQTASIPFIYAQLISQLIAEDVHTEDNEGHEAVRRSSYARRVLDAVAIEIKGYEGEDKAFRSKILTPILQRQLRGVPDCYTPSVCASMSEGSTPTIAEATEFYLSLDPVDPNHIPQYRRNLVYVAESRWYLGVLRGASGLKSVQDFDLTRKNHDKVMKALQQEPNGDEDDPDDDVPPFNNAEVQTIVDEGIEGFFKPELQRVVNALHPSHRAPLTSRTSPHPSLIFSKQQKLGRKGRRNAAVPKKIHLKKGNPEKVHLKKVHLKKGHPEKGHPEKVHPKKGHPEKGHPEKVHPKKGHPEKVHPEKVHLKKGHPEKVHLKKGHPEKVHPKKGHPKKGHPEKVHPEKVHLKKGHPEKVHLKKGHPEKVHPKKGHPKKGHPEKGNPKKGHPEKGHPKKSRLPVLLPRGHVQQPPVLLAGRFDNVSPRKRPSSRPLHSRNISLTLPRTRRRN